MSVLSLTAASAFWSAYVNTGSCDMMSWTSVVLTSIGFHESSTFFTKSRVEKMPTIACGSSSAVTRMAPISKWFIAWSATATESDAFTVWSAEPYFAFVRSTSEIFVSTKPSCFTPKTPPSVVASSSWDVLAFSSDTPGGGRAFDERWPGFVVTPAASWRPAPAREWNEEATASEQVERDQLEPEQTRASHRASG